jgi:hypothetical protein
MDYKEKYYILISEDIKRLLSISHIFRKLFQKEASNEELYKKSNYLNQIVSFEDFEKVIIKMKNNIIKDFSFNAKQVKNTKIQFTKEELK